MNGTWNHRTEPFLQFISQPHLLRSGKARRLGAVRPRGFRSTAVPSRARPRFPRSRATPPQRKCPIPAGRRAAPQSRAFRGGLEERRGGPRPSHGARGPSRTSTAWPSSRSKPTTHTQCSQAEKRSQGSSGRPRSGSSVASSPASAAPPAPRSHSAMPLPRPAAPLPPPRPGPAAGNHVTARRLRRERPRGRRRGGGERRREPNHCRGCAEPRTGVGLQPASSAREQGITERPAGSAGTAAHPAQRRAAHRSRQQPPNLSYTRNPLLSAPDLGLTATCKARTAAEAARRPPATSPSRELQILPPS